MANQEIYIRTFFSIFSRLSINLHQSILIRTTSYFSAEKYYHEHIFPSHYEFIIIQREKQINKKISKYNEHEHYEVFPSFLHWTYAMRFAIFLIDLFY